MTQKRQDYISWDEYFMGVAQLAGFRSKDPNSQVGACIVSGDNKILSIGYNGFPVGCSDDEFPWNREGEPYDSKYFYVTHAELNAILNYRGGSLEGSKVYVTMFPCNECAKAIIQSGIREVIYDGDKYADTPVLVSSFQDGGFLSVVVEDGGGGVSTEELPLIKEKFFRGSNAKHAQGAGLGLYISDYFMKEMQGELVVENGKTGLKVTVRIALSGTC